MPKSKAQNNATDLTRAIDRLDALAQVLVYYADQLDASRGASFEYGYVESTARAETLRETGQSIAEALRGETPTMITSPYARAYEALRR